MAALRSRAFAFVDEGVDEIGLAAGFELLFEKGGDLGEVGLLADGGYNGAAAGGEFVDEGDVEVAVDGHGEGAGNGGRGHDQHVGGGALADEAVALLDAEFMLFVDDGEAEVGEFGVAVEEGVGADEDLGLRSLPAKRGSKPSSLREEVRRPIRRPRGSSQRRKLR